MPTQEYNCPNDGAFDIHMSFAEDVPRCKDCPTCGLDSRHVLRAPEAKFARTWNEQANEARRNPYTQATAQSWNSYHEQRNLGVQLDKPTEAGIQVAAAALDQSERNPPPSAEQRQLANIRRDQKKKKQPA